jgi:hypothetical protein
MKVILRKIIAMVGTGEEAGYILHITGAVAEVDTKLADTMEEVIMLEGKFML